MAQLTITGTKSSIGLGNVDNTSDANKPVSTAQAAAIAVVQNDINTHEARTDNPHSVTKSQVGLSNADNTSDADKPISTLTQAALDLKQSISGLFSAVFGLVFSGFSAGSNSSIVDGITVGTAFARIQGQINARPNETATTIAAINHAAAPKTVLVDDDEVTGQDSASSFSLIRTVWSDAWTYIKSKADLIYPQKLATYTAASSSSFDIPLGSKNYRITLAHLVPGTDGVILNLFTSSNGGVSFDSSAGNYRHGRELMIDTPATAVGGSTSATEIALASNLGNNTGESLSGTIDIIKPSTATYFLVSYDLVYYTAAAVFIRIYGGGVRLAAADVDYIRLSMSVGNIATGTAEVQEY